ncbi:UNVERIFIED_CONTAM: hypothetical protein FKN15_059352 [Acipenser sinensis]
MTAKKSGSRLETEIERCRSEGQWDRIPELIRQLSVKLIANDDLAELLLGEAKLQQHLKENPIKQGASPRGAKPKLVEVRKHLTAALDRGNLKSEYMQEASLLMAKLNYVEGNYREALSNYFKVGLDDLQLVGIPVYRLSMIAEAYATKGNLNICRHDGFLILLRYIIVFVCFLKLEEGERFAKMVIDMGEKASEFRAKGYLAIGLVYSLKATDASLRGVQEEYQRKALGAFQRAQSLSPTDHLAAFYLALQHAVSRQIPEALGYVRQALQLQGDDVHSLHLLALLLSAQKHYHDALNIIEMALSEYPEHFILLFTKVKLESVCRGPDEALLTCKHMLQIWKSCYNLTNPSDSGRGSSLLDRTMADRRQINTMTLPDFSDPETGSVHATSIAASRVEQALSEVASSLQSSAPKQGPLHPWMTLAQIWLHAGSVHATSIAASRVEQALSEVASSLQSSAPKQGPLHPWMTLAQIWLHAAEVYTGIGKPAEATACTQEAANLFPTSHNVLFMRGQVAELRGNTDEAKRWYEEALSISPTHVKTMQRLKVLAKQELQMNLIKQSVEMYIHHGIYDLIFKYVGTIEASQVGSVHATSIAASRVEQALSEVASSLQSSAPKQGPLHPWMTLAQIWLHAAEVYTGIGKPAEATACTQEAANLFPTSHNVLFMRGQVAELRGNTDEAKRWYEEALSISPTHVKTMQRLGLILHRLGRYSLSEKILRDAVQVNPTSHDVWNSLGEVLQTQGHDDAATECFLTALELEASSPILPFTIIPRAL